MMQFRTRPVDVTAWQWNGETDLVSETSRAPLWIRTAAKTGLIYFYGLGHTATTQLVVRTPNGSVNSVPGDWVVRYPLGHLGRIAAAAFQSQFEEIA